MQFRKKEIRNKIIIKNTIFISSLLCLIRNNWILIWVFLEINTLSFCSVIKRNTKTSKKENDSSIKYFIIQSIASGILLFFVVTKERYILHFLSMFATTALIVKLAAAPFHEWFIKITKRMTWKNATILITWQKLAPTYLITFQEKTISFIFILLSSLIGAIFQINKKNVMEIIALSSVFNLRWILLAILINIKTFVYFITIYWISVTLIIKVLQYSFNINIIYFFSRRIRKWLVLFITANLAGIPPFSGFLVKWVVFVLYLKIHITPLISVILVIRTINFYIYLRLIKKTILKPKRQNQITRKSILKNLTIRTLIFSFSPLLLLVLRNAWKRTILIR